MTSTDEVAGKVATGKGLTTPELIALKSADIDGATAERHKKVFVLPAGPKPTEKNGYSHEANKAATVQYMLGLGLRPSGDVKLDSIKEQKTRRGVSIGWELTYSVGAIPASEYDPAAEPVYVVEPDVDEVPANTDNPPHGAGTGAPGTTVTAGKTAE